MLSLVEKLHLFEGLLAKSRYSTDEINMGFLSEERYEVTQYIHKLPLHFPGYKFLVSYALNTVIARYLPHERHAQIVEIQFHDPLKTHFAEADVF